MEGSVWRVWSKVEIKPSKWGLPSYPCSWPHLNSPWGNLDLEQILVFEARFTIPRCLCVLQHFMVFCSILQVQSVQTCRESLGVFVAVQYCQIHSPNTTRNSAILTGPAVSRLMLYIGHIRSPVLCFGTVVHTKFPYRSKLTGYNISCPGQIVLCTQYAKRESPTRTPQKKQHAMGSFIIMRYCQPYSWQAEIIRQYL